MDSDELLKRLEISFNLNRKRKFSGFFWKEDNQYTGELKDNSFKIIANNAFRSTNDGLYFFFTQITGVVTIEGGRTQVTLNADISQQIIGMVMGGAVVYLLILIFGSISLGLNCLMFVVGLMLYARYSVRKDFKLFEKEIIKKVSLHESKY